MPWHVAKSDTCPSSKPWAVIKDDDSSVVACHESEESAEDQVAALYASENERQATYTCECLDCGHVMDSEEHCADIECPECGGTMRRKERPGGGQRMGDGERTTVRDLWNRLKDKITIALDAEAKMASMSEAERFRAIGMGRVFEQVWGLLQESEQWAYPIDVYIGDDWIYTLATREGKLYRIDLFLDGEQVRLGDWQQVTEVHEPVAQRMIVQRQADGRWRWLNISASAVLNRVGEIDSRQLFDNMAQRAADTGEYPYRTFFHMGEPFRIGQADLLARDGSLYITSGVFDDNPLAQAIVRAIQEDPDYWGDSIGYLPLGEPERVEIAEGVEVPVYTDGIHREISTLPEQRAASLFTMPRVQQEVNRMRTEVMDALERLRDKHGLAQDVIDEFVQVADQTNRSIDDEELITREGEQPEAETEPEVEGEPEADSEPEPQERETEEPEGDLEIELDEDAVSAIVDRVAEAQFFTDQITRMDEMQATITDLVERLDKATKRAEEVERRLAELEKDDEDKQREWLEDQPRRRTLRVTHRPREASQARQGDKSLADDAAGTLASMPRY